MGNYSQSKNGTIYIILRAIFEKDHNKTLASFKDKCDNTEKNLWIALFSIALCLIIIILIIIKKVFYPKHVMIYRTEDDNII